MFVAYVMSGFKVDGENSRLQFRTNGGDVIVQLEPHRDGSHKVIARRSWKSTN
jgi:hypothetical protein